MRRAALVLLAACAASPAALAPTPTASAAPSAASAPVTTDVTPSASVAPSASAAELDGGAPMHMECLRPGLMLRTDAMPRSPAFSRGADAFDRATIDWNKHRYADAARGFMTASAEFAVAGAEGNWKYAWQNAAVAFETAGHVDEGRAAFEDAAKKDPVHAAQLRAAGASLSRPISCR